MKKVLFMFVFILSLFLVGCNEIEPIDEIESYIIYVSPTEEGNLELHYIIQWKVLDSTKEGPLEWVKIGIPNEYVRNLNANSSEIKKISYYDAGGSFIRLDLDRPYLENEIVTLDFSFTQTHIYHIQEDTLEYQIIPGWFDEIKVSSLVVYWEKENVVFSNHTTSNDDYYIWNATLDFGETIEVNVSYNKTNFINISENNAYKKDENNDIYILLFVLAIVFITLGIIGILSYHCSDHYYSYRGFSGRIHHWWRWHYFSHRGVNKKGERLQNPTIKNHSSSHHGGHSCACACACACAGGGRAGCSRKDFYENESETNQIIKNLK